jgi:S1-C subfamily serine protease
MERLLSKSIVSIRNSKKTIIGTGFLTNQRYILTCAHVVRDALDLKETPSEPPYPDIALDFHSLARNEIVTAKVVYWGPQDNTDGCESDIAVLRLIGFPPGKWEPAPLYVGDALAQDLFGHEYWTFGFPYDNGAFSYGLVKDERPNGSFHLEDTKEPGKPIVEGFSGAPVWDEKLKKVIGIISTSDEDISSKVAYMIPTKKIVEVFPDLLIDKREIEYTDVPIIIYAMNTQEAKELFDETAFNDSSVAPIELNRYKELKDILRNKGINIESLLEFYNENRDLWRPIIANKKAIKMTIKEIFKETNKNFESISITPEFFSNDFLSNDNGIRFATWDKLEDHGCILIIDAISMYHPVLRKKLTDSGFGSKVKVAIVMLSPIESNQFEINQILEKIIKEQMQRAFSRFDEKCEILCDFSINSIRTLKRWLFAALPRTIEIIRNVKIDLRNIQKWRNKQGEPIGIEKMLPRKD